MRRAIVWVAAAACIVGVAGGLTYALMAATTQDNSQDWRQDRLGFLKSTYDRIQADITVGGQRGAVVAQAGRIGSARYGRDRETNATR
jgi:hypothetical protein